MIIGSKLRMRQFVMIISILSSGATSCGFVRRGNGLCICKSSSHHQGKIDLVL